MRLLPTALVCLAAGVALAGCARSARLYPANEAAIAGGVLKANFMAYGTGHGEIEITLPDGEEARGEYSIVRGGAIGFGSVYGSVYGPNGVASYSGNSTSMVMPGGSQGMASLFGSRGTAMQCEFLNDNSSGHGHGACKTSKDALYRLQY